jgi:hypothetical protein
MNNVPGLSGRKVKENQEELYIADAALDAGTSSNSSAAKQERQSNHTSKLFCYPCSVTGWSTHNRKTLLLLLCGSGGPSCVAFVVFAALLPPQRR